MEFDLFQSVLVIYDIARCYNLKNTNVNYKMRLR